MVADCVDAAEAGKSAFAVRIRSYSRSQWRSTVFQMANDPIDEIPKFIRRVMPKASETELREATETFNEYMAVVWDIFQRIKREQAGRDSPKLGVCDRVKNIDPLV